MKIKEIGKKIKATVAAVLLAIATALGLYSVAADPVWTVSASMPTEYTSNQALPLSDLATMTVVWKVGAGAVQTKVVTVTQATVSTTIPKELGSTCVAAFVTTKATALVPNVSSAQTADVCVVNAGIPKTPTNIQVQ